MRLLSTALIFSLVCVAQDASPKDRARGVRDLAKQGASAIPQITPYLKDESVEVREEAATAIAQLGTIAALEPLQGALNDRAPEVRIPAIAGITNFYLPGYIDTGWASGLRRFGRGVKGRFTDTNTQMIEPSLQVRPEIIAALGKIVESDPDLTVRVNAARSLGILRGRAATGNLLAALKNRERDTDLIYESLVALQKIRNPEAAEGVVFLLTDLNEKVQIAAIETVGILRYAEAQPRLREALGRAKNNRVRRAALGALGMIPDESNRALFDMYIANRDEGLRAAAAEGIGRLGKTEDLPKIEKMFNDEQKKTAQLSLAFAAVMLGKREMTQFSPLDYLISSLNNSSWAGVAAPFLEELARNREVRESLYPNLSQRTSAEKTELARILALSGDQATVKVLEDLSRDPDAQVGLVATRWLGVLRSRL